MARKILKHLRSREHTHIGDEVIPVKPLPGQMEVGEIAMNYLAGYERIFIKNSDDEVVSFYPNGEGGSTPVTITVDDHLDNTSENPVQNKVIADAIAQIVAGGVVVDPELSPTSENPVQNKVITNALAGKQDRLTAGNNIDIDERQNIISASDAKVDQTELSDASGRFPFVLTGENLDYKQHRNSGVHYLKGFYYNPNDGTITFADDSEEDVNSVTIAPGEITFDNGCSINGISYGGTAERAVKDSRGDTISVASYATKEELMDDELVTAAALTKLNETAGFDDSGNYTPNGTNYIQNAKTLSEAIDILDSAISGSGGTDEKVAQIRIDATDSATDVGYPVLLAHDSNPNGASAGANYSGITYNPRDNYGTLVLGRNQTSQQEVLLEQLKLTSSGITFVTGSQSFSNGTLTRTQYSGTAAKATADGNGDNIVNTYLKKADLNTAIANYLEDNGIYGGEYTGEPQ